MVGYLKKEGDDWPAGTEQPMIVTDSRELWVGWVDDVGNRTDVSERKRINHVEWIATMGNKEDSSDYENPHEIYTVSKFGAYAAQETPLVNAATNLASIDEKLQSGCQRERLVQKQLDRQKVPNCLQNKMVYDALRGRVVMFCGSTGEVYEYDNHNWYHVPAIDPESDGDPGPLEGFAMAYYPPGGFTIVHGGKSPGTGNTMDESQWHWNGVSWGKVWVQTPVFDELIYRGHEGTRIGHELVYHEALERLFMIGGCFNSYDTDIYSCEAHQLANVGLNKCRTNEGLAPAHANLLGVAEQDLIYEFKEGGWTADVDGVIPNRVSVEEALEACLLEGEVRGGYHLPKVTYNPKAEKIVLWGASEKTKIWSPTTTTPGPVVPQMVLGNHWLILYYRKSRGRRTSYCILTASQSKLFLAPLCLMLICQHRPLTVIKW